MKLLSKYFFNKAILTSKPFKTIPIGYGADDNERCIEIEFVRTYYQGENKVLDVGYSFAEPRWFDMIGSLYIPNLIGIDISPSREVVGYKKTIQGDIRNTKLKTNTFDSIFCVSILEHVGMDNQTYTDITENNPNSQLKAMREMYRILKPNGKLLLTLPFGKYMDYKWFIQYDLKSLYQLIINSNFKTRSLQSFKVDKYWKYCLPNSCSNILYQEPYHRAGSVICLLLNK